MSAVVVMVLTFIGCYLLGSYLGSLGVSPFVIFGICLAIGVAAGSLVSETGRR